ncbi:MAG: glycosyltransferase family 2 protein [Candidatus Eisenbacteria bacterium]|uniref:Glycosyltransferase family 2 protein n=1 Tax=Eiseniibacteriota bacterium TaxID=2212470 RepID=A0A9D6LA26_UNCEI|nr:glycosyltransferase family 2 protein [Candidatus Eisenbacteria bacterium]MBI3540360.1 glycosyltransferase family 2 protein [Candidatus Eisenbacteria bacterium]
MNDARSTLISVLCPVFNEEPTVPLFYERLNAALAPLADRYDFEILFSDNRSTDRTAERVLELRAKDPRVQLLSLSRNFGYQHSIVAALRQAAGEAMCVIDADCEDPPEMIVTFIRHWEEGYDVVYGVRDLRAEPFVLTWLRKIFYRVNRMIADSDILLDMAEFCMISADVRDAVVANQSTFPFVRAEIAHVGYRRMGIRYNRQRRIAGRSHYSLYGMWRFAVAGILSSTTVPLRIPLYLLPPLLAVNGLGFWGQVTGRWPWGFELLVMADLLYLAVGVAFLSLYTARNYRNVVGRPVAVVDWRRSALNSPRERSPNDLERLGPRC